MGILTEELIKIIVTEIVGTGCCVAGTNDFTPAFLNSAVGQLYGSFPIELIESGLKSILRMPALAGRH